MKKVIITNGSGTNGKDTFSNLLNKYIPTHKYSSINLVKQMLEIAGVDTNNKTEELRKLCSDIKDILTKYGDIPFKDVSSIVMDFKDNLIETDVLLIDIREPEEIARAVKIFGAETILIRNPNVAAITTNHADANVENYTYDYIIENNGTLEHLEEVAKEFAKYIQNKNEFFPNNASCILNSDGKTTMVFECNKMLR